VVDAVGDHDESDPESEQEEGNVHRIHGFSKETIPVSLSERTGSRPGPSG
jgi:hypothetical protein